MFTLLQGDCLEVLQAIKDNSVDAVVTDPPYGLSFMGKKWDYDVPSVDVWKEVLRVLKPGGHLLSFAGTRTQHRMAVNIEDAGLEIRDMIAWVYGSGFPKSLDVSKAIDKEAGVEREVIGVSTNGSGAQPNKLNNHGEGDTGIGYADGSGKVFPITAPATEAAKQWEGWGTALKPSLEPITVARKPFKGTVAANVQEYGTGAINVDGCRVEANWDSDPSRRAFGYGVMDPNKRQQFNDRANGQWGFKNQTQWQPTQNRFPANLIHDGSDEVTALLNSAARFFYCAKASKADRDEGLDEFHKWDVYTEATVTPMRDMRTQTQRANHHPTVKPTDLMRYLCRLVTPPNGIILDPFTGSGSTGKAAMLEGFKFIGIERESEYIDIARARIKAVINKSPLFANA